jgi:hypothetical protein
MRTCIQHVRTPIDAMGICQYALRVNFSYTNSPVYRLVSWPHSVSSLPAADVPDLVMRQARHSATSTPSAYLLNQKANSHFAQAVLLAHSCCKGGLSPPTLNAGKASPRMPSNLAATKDKLGSAVAHPNACRGEHKTDASPPNWGN